MKHLLFFCPLLFHVKHCAFCKVLVETCFLCVILYLLYYGKFSIQRKRVGISWLKSLQS